MSGLLRPIGEIVAGLFPKLIIRFHLNDAMSAAAPLDAVNAFMAANSIRQELGLTWAQVLANDNRQSRGAA